MVWEKFLLLCVIKTCEKQTKLFVISVEQINQILKVA